MAFSQTPLPFPSFYSPSGEMHALDRLQERLLALKVAHV